MTIKGKAIGLSIAGTLTAASIGIATYDGPVEAKPPVKTLQQCEQDFVAAGKALTQKLETENPGKSSLSLAAKMAKHPEGKQINSTWKTCKQNYAKSQSQISIEILGYGFKIGGL